MGSLKREERQTLRRIQEHLRASTLDANVVIEQMGTVDIFFHPNNPDPHLNCITPHKGVAWVRNTDLSDAFDGMERLGRVPRLVFQEALFPEAFQRQLQMMGLREEETRVVMVYRPFYGPALPGEMLRGRLPEGVEGPVTTFVANTSPELATWLRVFRAGYYNTETLRVEPEAVQELVEQSESEQFVFVLASYQSTPLGATRIAIRAPTAELEAVVTAPLWHGMGLETAMVVTAVREMLRRGCDTVFTIAPPEDYTRLYRRLGFMELTNVLTYWLGETAGETDS